MESKKCELQGCENIVEQKTKREKRFCSDVCRVMFHRGSEKKSAKVLPEWVSEIEQYCNQHNCAPIDLIKGRDKSIPRPSVSLFQNEPTEAYYEKLRKEKYGI